MCIIAIKPKNVNLWNDETLNMMFANNPDGCGYAYYNPDTKKVVIRKGYFSVKSLKKSWKQIKGFDLNKQNVILHFRIGTSGLNDALNCHPYPIYQKNATFATTTIAMAHNGILLDFEPPKKSAINDTQIFIRDVLSHLKPNFLYDANSKMLIEKLIGSSNKLAFLDNRNHITTIGHFIEDGGYMYSNTSYKTPRYYHQVETYDWQNYYDDAYSFYNSNKDAVITPCVSKKTDCVSKKTNTHKHWVRANSNGGFKYAN